MSFPLDMDMTHSVTTSMEMSTFQLTFLVLTEFWSLTGFAMYMSKPSMKIRITADTPVRNRINRTMCQSLKH